MSDLTQFEEPLDLRKDVVASDRLINRSTYLVTRAWLNNVLSHCARDGTEVQLEGRGV